MEKLVRDRVPHLINSTKGHAVQSYRQASDNDMPRLLGKKLIEEAEELKEEMSRGIPIRETIIQELADVREVVNAIKEYYGITHAELFEAGENKREAKGSFKNRFVMNF